MPTVRELEPMLKESSVKISSLPGVEELLTWGTYAECIRNKETPIREVELLVKCSFDSGDLLAIEKGPMGPFNIPFRDLEEEGFNPKAVKFTKGLLKACEFNVDYWCLSSDKQMLHWGPVADTIDEWRDLRKKAEEEAEAKTGYCRKTLKKASQQEAQEWIQLYENTLRLFIDKGPLGWYQASVEENDDLLKSAIKLA